MTGKHGAVMLIVMGLSERVTHHQLKTTFKQLIKSRWRNNRWSGQGMIRSCDIVRVTDNDTGERQYHGLVELQPAKLALLAIRELDGTKIGDHAVTLRRYHHRSPVRHQNGYAPEGGALDSQAEDNRRANLTIELVTRRVAPWLPSLLGLSGPDYGRGYRLEEPERHTS